MDQDGSRSLPSPQEELHHESLGFLAVALALVSLAPGLVRGDDREDEAKKIAVKITTEGAATFDTQNASAMAAYYAEDARLSLVIRSNEGFKTEYHNGRAEIENAYDKLFEKPRDDQVVLTT